MSTVNTVSYSERSECNEFFQQFQGMFTEFFYNTLIGLADCWDSVVSFTMESRLLFDLPMCFVTSTHCVKSSQVFKISRPVVKFLIIFHLKCKVLNR